jgi:hypothetical protein
MAGDPNSTKPRLPDRARAGSTSRAPRLAPTDPMWWPEDPHGLTFLARFVNEVGLRVFAASWTGTEVVAAEFNLLPKLAKATRWHRRRADDLLSVHRPDLEWTFAFTHLQDNPEHWRIAQQLAKRDYQEGWPASSARLQFVITTIIRWSRTGELPLKICHVLGGLPREFQPGWLDRPEPECLFYRCIIDPDDPFGRRPNRKTDNNHYIYAPREALERIVIASPNAIHHPEAEPQLPRAGSVDPPNPPVREPSTESDLDEAAEASREKHPGGKAPVWNWKGVIALLQQRKAGEGPFKGKKTTFNNRTMFKQFIQERVQRTDGSDRGDGPNSRTVDRAITKYKLEQYAAFEE